MDQAQMYFDTDYFEEVISDAVAALGGRKKVGSRLWGSTKTVADASRYLSHCLDPERPEKLHMSEMLKIMQWAREECDFHGPMQYLSTFLNYEAPVPKDPENENMRLMREFVEMGKRMEHLGERIKKNNQLRAVS